MHSLRLRTRFAPFLLAVLLATQLLAADRANLLNPWAVHNETRVDASAAASVKEFFPTFLEYQDLVMFHPKFGYYASGRVNFESDYRTFPDALYPYFGHMITEHIFNMWDGMRKAGTLADSEKFTIAEFGAGDGALAESILNYVDQRAGSTVASADRGRWGLFSKQLVYACYDRSPSLSAQQRKRNSRFGARFEAREGDATDPTATIAPGSLTGVVLSNELPDAFSVYKVLFSPDGSAETGYVAPSLSRAGWARLEGKMGAELKARLIKEDVTIQTRLFTRKRDDTTFLSRAGFISLLESIASGGTDATDTKSLEAIDFHEIFLPIDIIPELADHVRKYASEYAYQVARGNKDIVSYVNLGEGRFMQGMGRILKAGYVITVDYGSNWDTVSPLDFDHFRSYGPGSQVEHSDPYHWPTLNDMTSDVNFSHMAEEGKSSGLLPLYFGAQSSLLTGTGVSIDETPPNRDAGDFELWIDNFYQWNVYKILVEQKEKTDPAYSFPGTEAEPLTVSVTNLPQEKQKLAKEVEQRLTNHLAAAQR
jgi:SAM-dependent MidA family methyltransferase